MKWARETGMELGLSTSAPLRKFVKWVNTMEEQVLGPLGILDQRLDSPEAKQAQLERHYLGSGSESWQDLSTSGGAAK